MVKRQDSVEDLDAVLGDEFKSIGRNHSMAIRRRAARVVLGSSVIRVFKPGTKDPLLACLNRIPVDEMVRCRSQAQFRPWFERQLARVSRTVVRHNEGNGRVEPGQKWGHSTKILCLFLRELVLNSRYFSDARSARLAQLLYVPVDGVIMKRLRSLGVRLPYRLIRQIDSPGKFYRVQDLLGEAADRHHVPRIWFDDVWATRGEGGGS